MKLRSLCGKFRPVPSQDEKSDREAFSKEWNSPGSPSLRPVSLQVPQVPQVHRSHRSQGSRGPTAPTGSQVHRSHISQVPQLPQVPWVSRAPQIPQAAQLPQILQVTQVPGSQSHIGPRDPTAHTPDWFSQSPSPSVFSSEGDAMCSVLSVASCLALDAQATCSVACHRTAKNSGLPQEFYWCWSRKNVQGMALLCED